MYSIIILVIVIAGVIFYDHVRFWKKTEDFMIKSQDLCNAYNYVLKRLKETENGDDEILYEGTMYKITVEKGDYRSFTKQIQLLVCDVLDSYDEIGERYLFEMADELRDDIEETYEKVQRIDQAVRLTLWQNEWR